MKEIVKKIAAAKKEIRETKIKKDGRNSYSEYDYFTPTQVETLVSRVCENHSLLTKFDLIRNELGVVGQLTIFDLDSEDSIIYTMATDIPAIKATNIAQQLGGCLTYTERYLKTTAFGIIDNNLDLDTTINTKKSEQEKKDKEKKLLEEKTIRKKAAIDEITKTTSKENLLSCWSQHKEFQLDKDFVNAKDEQKKSLGL